MGNEGGYQISRMKNPLQKSANLKEVHFALLRNVDNFQKLNRTGMKNAEKE